MNGYKKYHYIALFSAYDKDKWNEQLASAAIKKGDVTPSCLYVFYGKNGDMSQQARVVSATLSQNRNRTNVICRAFTDPDKDLVNVVLQNISQKGKGNIIFFVSMPSNKRESLQEIFTHIFKKNIPVFKKAKDINDVNKALKEIEESKKENSDDVGAEIDDLANQGSGSTNNPDSGALARGSKKKKKQERKSSKNDTNGQFDPAYQRSLEAAVLTGSGGSDSFEFEIPMTAIDASKAETALQVFNRTIYDMFEKKLQKIFFTEEFLNKHEKNSDKFREACNELFMLICTTDSLEDCYNQWKIMEPNIASQTFGGSKNKKESVEARDEAYQSVKKGVEYYAELCDVLYNDDPNG